MTSRKWRYDDPERRRYQDPEAILRKIGLRPGMTFVDVGCAEGFFAIPAARIVGKRGQVLALDVNRESVERLRENVEAEKLGNVAAEAGEAEKRVLCEGCADIVFFGNDLHDMGDPARALANAGRMLRPGGRLADLDWKKEPMDLGPPLEIRFGAGEAALLIRRAGFLIGKIAEAGPYHYLIVAKRGKR